METDSHPGPLRSSGSEAARFDRLARSLTAIRPRRHAVLTLLGGTLGLVNLTDVTAKKQNRKGKKGKKGKGKRDEDQCPTERVCAEGCCDEGQVCQDGTACCTEDVDAICESLGVSCGERPGPCGRNVNCGTCPQGSICPSIACCRDLGSSCGPSAGGAQCCSGVCGPRNSTGDYVCRRVNCIATGTCNSTSDCCQGQCVVGDLTKRCSAV